MVLRRRYNENRGRQEWALVSTKNPNKILYWFGINRPSQDEFLRQERRVKYWTNVKGHPRRGRWVRRHTRRLR